MPSKFVNQLLTEINKFRADPSGITKSCELVKKGMSRINAKDPFLKEIDIFLSSIEDLPEMNQLTLNPTLTKIAEEQVKEYINNEKYVHWQKGKALEKILPVGFMEHNPCLIADDGADEPVNVITKVLLNKLDKSKQGRAFLTNPEYTQVGLAQHVYDDENFVIIILANDDAPAEEEDDEWLPEGDLTELKQAFDLFDRDGSQTIKIEEAITAMKSMKFDETNPVLFEILNELTDKTIVSWPKFACHVVKRLTNRKNEDGLRTIFDLFIDNPKTKTITFETFKKICREIGETLTEEEMKHILANTTENGNEITFSDFCQYMKVE